VIPAYRYDQGHGDDYFDDRGASLRKAFLKAPVEFSRISSRYNLKRFHPVLNRMKAHLGTDYAAPHGTPIVAVGDGTVIKSGYTSGNGNYVKIRHNSTYETQYLHMSKRAVRVGEAVRQGQVIGYVGSTGLATGPHVCFRFWKNGKQVDHLREEFPPSEPIESEHLAGFQTKVAELKAELEGS
jgi:murein DD-endopeptidase MepM/ murein hydrolase activator NlpD